MLFVYCVEVFVFVSLFSSKGKNPIPAVMSSIKKDSITIAYCTITQQDLICSHTSVLGLEFYWHTMSTNFAQEPGEGTPYMPALLTDKITVPANTYALEPWSKDSKDDFLVQRKSSNFCFQNTLNWWELNSKNTRFHSNYRVACGELSATVKWD